MKHFDVIVVGLGAVGAAVTYQCAKRGLRTLGIDRFHPPHDRGSSHGESRMTRLNAMEGDEYVALVRRSHQLWREIESETSADIMNLNGGLIIESGPATTAHGVQEMMAATRSVALKHQIPHRDLSAVEVQREFPQFNIPESATAYYEPSAGYLRPEEAVRAQLELSQRHGAELIFGERVSRYHGTGNVATVEVGATSYSAARVILSAGPWLTQLGTPEFAECLKVYRQVLYWFAPIGPSAHFASAKCPVFVWLRGGTDLVYGFPVLEGGVAGVKLATEECVNVSTPDDVVREVSETEIAKFYEYYVRGAFPGLSSRCLKAQVCMYTVAPRSKFLIRSDSKCPQVLLISACSGHGFKHSAALGEAVAERVQNGYSTLDIFSFGLSAE